MQVTNPGENPARRALLQALDEAMDQLKMLPLNSPIRPHLAAKIVELEDRLTAIGEV